MRIGIRLVSAEQRLVDTLQALFATIGRSFVPVILADPAPGEEAGVDALLDGVRGVAQWRAPFPGGAPACFNRLFADPAELYVLIEAGALPAPEWLDRLAAALGEHTFNGLAGPSTNHCWNEQAIAPSSYGTPVAIERVGERLAREHGAAWRSLAPLHGIGEFCMAVRGDVVAAVGAADTAYGRGPCWEMDYAARAALAGFRSVWVPGAFVWRAAREQDEAASASGLASAKRRYQDRFCGRRGTAEGAALPYRDHCRGGTCANFGQRPPAPLALPRAVAGAGAVPDVDPPMISCVMPTRGRARFVARAIAYFRAQDYPNRELIIVHDDDDDLPAEIAGDDIRVLRATASSIGAKRNQGVAVARGTIVAQWDDDDWYGPGRLSHQAAPILAGVAEITALNDSLFLDVERAAFWSTSRTLYRDLFVENVAGGTLMFRREDWRRDGPYPTTSLREDSDLLVRMMRGGARLCRRSARDHWIYVRHPHNTWRFEVGRYRDPAAWRAEPEPPSFTTDRNFYRAVPAGPARMPAAAASAPMVSCIMPTADRREFVPTAIRRFLAQDHPVRELIVIDDGQRDVADLIPEDPRVRYLRLTTRQSVGAKRNLACAIARGEIVVHWDDDDWMANRWLSTQVAVLREADAEITGLANVLFYAPATRRAWRYVYDGAQPWVYGGTLCYTRAYWQRAPFPDLNIGEDNAFVWNRKGGRIAINPAEDLYVATVHGGNTSVKDTSQSRWQAHCATRVERLIYTPDDTFER